MYSYAALAHLRSSGYWGVNIDLEKDWWNVFLLLLKDKFYF